MIAACVLLAAALLAHRWAGRVLAYGVATVELVFDTRALVEGFRQAELAAKNLAGAMATLSDAQLDLLDQEIGR